LKTTRNEYGERKIVDLKFEPGNWEREWEAQMYSQGVIIPSADNVCTTKKTKEERIGSVDFEKCIVIRNGKSQAEVLVSKERRGTNSWGTR
jgi:hypothetical protein